MSDTTSPPLDIGSTTDPSSTPPTNTDPTATNPADPNATNASDPNAGAADPNAGATDPNAGADDSNTGIPADPNSSTPTSVIDSDAGSPQTTGSANLPSAIPGASLGQSTSVTAVPTPSPSGIAGSDRDNGGAVVAFDSKNAQYRKAIIIASAVSGAVGLILVVAVIFVVYRRRNRRNRNNATFVNAAVPRPKPARPASDATWIGTRLEDGSDGSFDVGKLEAGSRTSEAGSIDSDTTLADFAAARAKSGAFSTPTHSPRPSLEKIKVANMPMVPEDPFEAPVLSMADRPRPSLEQMINPVPQSAPTPRRGKSGAPHMRINSNSSYTGEVVIEQGFDNGVRSPGFMIPLVTPVEPPANWRAQSDDDFIPPPPVRGSMVPLSRQSSRASSRNSRDLDAEVVSPSKKSVFTAIAKKRRSRADSIDPFRKSAASMAARRKSRAESMASRNGSYASSGAVRRKSRAESVAAPKSPGGRRKSRAGSIRRVQPANPIFDPTQDMGYYSVSAAQQVPRTPIGLPKTPRTPTAARQSRVMNGSEPRTPRAARGPLPLPPTPGTSGIQQPRTPGIERPRTPVERARTPGIDRPRTPGTERPRTPGAQQPRTPVTAREPRTPRTAQDPRTPGSRTRTPKVVVPRTPTSLDDAHWDSVPLALPAPVARPPPSAPLPGGRAELRMSQLSRALSEVSRDSPI